MSIHSPSLAKYNHKHLRECEAVAAAQAGANPSDPFTYARVLSHMLCGHCLISDYQVDFRKEQRKYVGEDGKELEYTVEVPVNQKHP